MAKYRAGKERAEIGENVERCGRERERERRREKLRGRQRYKEKKGLER